MDGNRTNLQIKSFIVFDPTLTDNENEGIKKILYCHPNTISIIQQTNTIGLCEAMCNFAREFTDSPVQFIHTMKTRIILHRLENDIWMLLTVNVPKVVENFPKILSIINHKKTEIDDYQEEEIQNSICESIINHCRQMFFLFMGPPSLIIKKTSIESLKKKLVTFFDRYIGKGMLDDYHITDGLTGVHYLSVDSDLFSNTVDLVSNLQSKFGDIYSSIFMFNNNIVYSTVEKEDLGIIYRYLITSLLSRYNVNETMTSVFTMTHLGRFILVSPEPSLDSQITSYPTVFFRTNNYLRGDESSIKKCLVVVYKAVQATVVLFVEESADIKTFQFAVDKYLGPEITTLLKSIVKKTDKITASVADSPYKYVYWNPENLSMKCTLFATRQFKSEFAPLVPIDSLQLMSDIRVELDRDREVKEMAVKLHSESWVSAMKNSHQELFVAVNRKNISFVDVSKEVKLVCNRDLADVFKFNGE